VLGAILRRVALRPVDPAPERTIRRAIVFAPSRGAEAVPSRVG
jgi:hypothetical protein